MNDSTLSIPFEPQNERKTENLVRKHFEQYDSEITIEEQRSASPRIDKLLRSASKSGKGRGNPEFIIQFYFNQSNAFFWMSKATVNLPTSCSRWAIRFSASLDSF